ncbi:MAG TPA: hypothetical protein VHU40_10835 [Polyangia bacterium]|nr:hypothetical protein [Polyangia bacterium]
MALLGALAACSGSPATGGSGGAPGGNTAIGSGGSIASGAGGSVAGGAGGTAAGGLGGAVEELDFQNGTRLVARTFSSAGTRPLFVGVYDRQQKVECEFRATPDGKLRCLPANAIGTAEPDTVLPLDQWQEGVEAASPNLMGRLVLNQIHSADGGRFPNWIQGEFRDGGFGQPCRPDTSWQPDGTGDGFCLPDHANAGGVFFSDAACSQPLATFDSGQHPLLAATPKRELFALGDLYQGPTYISFAMGATCQALGDSSTPAYRIGAALATGTVAPVKLVPRGTGRLRLQMIESEGRTVAPLRHRDLTRPSSNVYGPYFDSQLGLLCQPVWMMNGDVRCAPTDAIYEPAAWLTGFADPACTQPVVIEKRPVAVIVSPNAAAPRDLVIEIRRVGDKPTSTGYTRSASGTCGESLKSAGYPLGDVVPFETYARLDVATGVVP